MSYTVERSYNLNPGKPSLEWLMEVTNGTGHHLRVCLPVADTLEGFVSATMRDQREVKHCTRCGAEVWYEPSGSVYPPGEHIVCTRRCLRLALMAAVQSDVAKSLYTRGTALSFIMSDAHIAADPRASALVKAEIRRATTGES